MGNLIYTGITSLDGYINDANGNFDWSMPDAQVHQFINDLERSVGTYLLGRRMYEVMSVWDVMPADPDSPVMNDYAEIWRAAEKIVFSASLAEVTASRTRLERIFDTDAVRALWGDVSIGGATLAAEAIEAGMVDEFRMFVNPIIVGGGTSYFPSGVTVPLDLVEQRRFDNGVVFLRYRRV
ncbi:MAG: dihydrofolate reductase family protein [Rhodoglobus sp.]